MTPSEGSVADAQVVRAESLTKRFGGVVAVDDLSFELQQGTITGFLGRTAPARRRRFACCSGWRHRQAAGRFSSAGPTPSSRSPAAGWVRYSKQPTSIPAGPAATTFACSLRRSISRTRASRRCCGSSSFGSGTLLFSTVAGAALWGAIGVGVGAIVRSQVGAIIGLLAWGFVAENLIFGFLPGLGRFGPVHAQDALVEFTTKHLLGPAPGGLVLVAWAAALSVLARHRSRRPPRRRLTDGCWHASLECSQPESRLRAGPEDNVPHERNRCV